MDSNLQKGVKQMKVSIETLIKHLNTQMSFADSIDSAFVYITRKEAEKCLELAEVEETLLAEPVKPEMQDESSSWWLVCGACNSKLDPDDRFCRNCGRKIKHRK